MKRRSLVLVLVVLTGALLLSTTALAADAVSYRAVLTPLNNSGVSGVMEFTVQGDQMSFHVDATGLEPDRAHGMQIRGFSGTTTDAVLPPSYAAGADGILTLDEAMGYLGIDKLL